MQHVPGILQVLPPIARMLFTKHSLVGFNQALLTREVTTGGLPHTCRALERGSELHVQSFYASFCSYINLLKNYSLAALRYCQSEFS